MVVTGLLKDAKGNVIPDAQVTINCNADNVSTSTNKNGVYSYSIKPTSVGLNNVSVVYTGNRSYTGSDAKTTFNANKLATTIKVNPVNGIIGEDITLTAHITDINGKAVTGGNLVFKLNGKTLRTDGRFDSKQTAWKFKVENGQVTVTIKADLYLRNTKNLTASYSGSYKYEEAKSEIVTAQIKKRNAKLSLTLSPKTQKQYKTITFTAKLTDITSNHKNKTAIYTNTKILFKINGVSLKNKNGITYSSK